MIEKEVDMKKRFSGKEYKAKICDEEELNVCLFSISDHGRVGNKCTAFVCFGALLTPYASGIGCWEL